MREGKRTEYNVCIVGYYNTESLRNTRFDREEVVLLESLKSQKRTQIPKVSEG